jgi:hypothetical protein
MNWALLASELLPGVVKLAWEAMSAIVAGKPGVAARKAEEAARRQAVRLAADAALAAKK